MTRLRRLLLVTASCVAVASSACSHPREAISVEPNDKEMQAAITRARAEVGRFTEALRHPAPGDRLFSVKVRIEDGTATEHFWLAAVEYDGVAFTGKLDNDPEFVRGHRIGETVRVPMGEVSDWMYVRNDVLVGGYTVRLLRQRMSPSERQRREGEMDFRID